MAHVSQGFVGRLESLRGIAALGVAIFHALIWIAFGAERALFTQTVESVHGVQVTIARTILSAFCGPAAVIVFFVLSGFVLVSRSVNTWHMYCVGVWYRLDRRYR
ncbi:acyltransferase family protein, partial [Ralstonia pseudosolanacearum]|nr:acyltransferase family protein [Ralstonia pseudosolanacearum]